MKAFHEVLLISFSFFIAINSNAQNTDLSKLNDTKTFRSLYNQLKQVRQKTEDKEGWSRRGDISLTFNQSNFSKWAQGGENSISANMSFRYFLSYNVGKITWVTRLWAAYGFTSLQSDLFEKKTQDLLILNSVLGKEISKNFFASFFVNFTTQFTKGYKYVTVDKVSTRIENSTFMSPGNFKVGMGLFWKKSDFLNVNLSPLTASIIFVNKRYTLPDGKYYGVKQGENARLELGSNLEAYLKLELIENVSAEQILTFYANYLEDFGNVDIFYTLNIVMKVNKFLSANFNFDTIYNDNIYQGFQVRQILGVGVAYSF